MTKEEILSKIEVLENIGGYTIEIEELRSQLNKSFSINEEIKHTSIGFSSWLWSHGTPPTDFFRKWKYGYPEEEYTLQELFEIFLKIPNHQKNKRTKERATL